MSNELKTLRAEAQAFCAANLRECCIELTEWRTKGTLRDGKVRELGALCDKYVGEHDGLKNAEAMIDFQACQAIATPAEQPAKVAMTVDTDEFSSLVGDLLQAFTQTNHGEDESVYVLARRALIAHIDAWAARSIGAALDAPLYSTRKDAARYRFLRDGTWNNLTHPQIKEHLITHVNRAALDAALDAAIAAAPAPDKGCTHPFRTGKAHEVARGEGTCATCGHVFPAAPAQDKDRT
jgi:hypothetical protein